MRKNLLFFTFFASLSFTVSAQVIPEVTLFSQNFNGTLADATTSTTYPAVGDANKFDAILSGAGTPANGPVTTSIINNKLRIERVTGNKPALNGGIVRATEYGAANFMHYSFVLSNVTHDATAVNAAYQLGIGTFANANAGYAGGTGAAFCRINFNFLANGNDFNINANTTTGGETTFNTNTYPVTIDVYAYYSSVSGTNTTATYIPSGKTVSTTLTPNTFDVYVTQNGVITKVVDKLAAYSTYLTDANTGIPHFKFSTAAAAFTGSVDVDDFVVKSGGVTLPVSLTTLTGVSYANAISLKWSTASEQNNTRFDILRSEDGKNFSKIGSVSGNGTSVQTHHYSYNDVSPVKGTNYYKLHQVDLNGGFSESSVIAVHSKFEGRNQLNIYSSPDKPEVKLFYYSEESAIGSVRIFDLTGKKIVEKNVSINKGYNEFIVPVSLLNGLHIANVVSGTNTVSQKFNSSH